MLPAKVILPLTLIPPAPNLLVKGVSANLLAVELSLTLDSFFALSLSSFDTLESSNKLIFSCEKVTVVISKTSVISIFFIIFSRELIALGAYKLIILYVLSFYDRKKSYLNYSHTA